MSKLSWRNWRAGASGAAAVRPPGRLGRLVLSGLVAAILGSGIAAAAPPTGTTRIEEDWELQVGTPDPAVNAPQIVTAMSSTNELADVHVVFELNHQSLPHFQAGSMQLQVWSGDTLLDYRNAPNWGAFNTTGETVTWTTSMSLSGGMVTFEIKNGSSHTWGNFGGQGWLKSTLTASQNHLSLYSPDFTKTISRVGYAKHCVQHLKLKRIRYYDQNGTLLDTDWADRVVHDLASP